MRLLSRDRELIPRWLFLRALGLIFVSAFYSFARQIHGLIGEQGILPAGDYLAHVTSIIAGPTRFWYVPTLFWVGAGDRALTIAVVLGIIASLLLAANVWPRAMLVVCTALFLSFVSTLQDFSAYQSDGMLLEAGFISIFFAPGGFWPGLGGADPPTKLSLFLLRWEWFRIYFESGLVKILSGDPHWRDFTAMDNYYQNGPLPAWPGWYVQHFPHWYHALTVGITFAIELFIVWAVFLPRRFRYLCFIAVTALQVGIIATANYAFLNYLVLVLGFLLLDDRACRWVAGRLRVRLPGYDKPRHPERSEGSLSMDSDHSVADEKPRHSERSEESLSMDSDPSVAPLPQDDAVVRHPEVSDPCHSERSEESLSMDSDPSVAALLQDDAVLRHPERSDPHPPARIDLRSLTEGILLGWVFYATLWAFLAPGSGNPLAAPERLLEPFRIANAYGLFATMTQARYEIEFQGSTDGGATWTPYAFKYKPQDVYERPGIYAPYQPRFDWNLWFASLGPWQQSTWVVAAQMRLAQGSREVLSLFRDDPFHGRAPARVRTVLWQYWFTDIATKRATGAWWRRRLLGTYTGVVTRGADGRMTFEPDPNAVIPTP